MKKRRRLNRFISTFLIGAFLFATCVPQALAEDKIYFYHNDHLGSPLAMTNMAKEVVWERDYKPFGQEIDLLTIAPNTHSYTGKEFDAETGLYYYGARYYDPVTGRFISIDPVGGKPDNPQTWNRYAYTLNNPYKYVDPDGEFPFLVFGLAALGAFVYGNLMTPGVSNTAMSAGDVYSGPSDREVAAKTTIGGVIGGLLGIAGTRALGLEGSATAGKEALPDEIFMKKSPGSPGSDNSQVTPGTKRLEGQYMNDQGRVEPWEAHYDEFGRQIGRTDRNAGNKAAGIPDTHHHTREYNAQYPEGHSTGDHIPGEYKP